MKGLSNFMVFSPFKKPLGFNLAERMEGRFADLPCILVKWSDPEPLGSDCSDCQENCGLRGSVDKQFQEI